MESFSFLFRFRSGFWLRLGPLACGLQLATGPVRSGPVRFRFQFWFRSGPFRLNLKRFVYLKSGSALRCALNACDEKTIIFQFPGGCRGNQNSARTIAHSPPGVTETLNYWLKEKWMFFVFAPFFLSARGQGTWGNPGELTKSKKTKKNIGCKLSIFIRI